VENIPPFKWWKIFHQENSIKGLVCLHEYTRLVHTYHTNHLRGNHTHPLVGYGNRCQSPIDCHCLPLTLNLNSADKGYYYPPPKVILTYFEAAAKSSGMKIFHQDLRLFRSNPKGLKGDSGESRSSPSRSSPSSVVATTPCLRFRSALLSLSFCEAKLWS